MKRLILFIILVLPTACIQAPPRSQSSADADAAAIRDGGERADADGSSGLADAAPDLGPCSGTCSGDTPICDDETGTCVGCLDDEHCAEGVCDPDTFTCVECLENEDCTDPEAAVCVDSTCTPCGEPSDCSHFSDPKRPFCDSGTCIECFPGSEAEDCDGTFCDAETHLCTDIPVGDSQGCEPCTEDSDCDAQFRCVPMQFRGSRYGDFCLPIRAQEGCSAPFGGGVLQRETLSGVSGLEFCGIKESYTTCDGLLDYGSSCADGTDAGCGGESSEDALCREIDGVPQLCTYRCTKDAECKPGVRCGGSQVTPFCGGG